MKTIGFLVLKGGSPCGLVNVAGTKKGGVLMPADFAIEYTKRRDARRAIDRTKRVAELLKDSMFAGWDRAQPLFDGKPFSILPVQRQ